MQHTYMRRHVIVKAIQFTGKNFFEVQTFINGRQPDIKSSYASEKWEEYCQKCEKQGHIEVPSSLGYNPLYQRCTPNDWIVEPEPGVYNVMAPETFNYQFREMPTGEEIRDVSGIQALAEGYGPLKIELPHPDVLINSAVANLQADLTPEFKPGELVKRYATIKSFMPQADFDNLLKDLTIETDRAIKQHARWVATGKSTASHGGSHDTCFAFILTKYIDTDVHKHYGLSTGEFAALPDHVRDTMFSMHAFAKKIKMLKEERAQTDATAELMNDLVRARQGDFPVGIIAPEVERPQYQGIASADELTRIMAQAGRWETGASILRGRVVNWHTLVEEGQRVFGTLGVCVGMRKNDQKTVWLDVAFSQNEGDSFLIVNNLLATFMFPDSDDEHNHHQPQYDEMLCCPPQEFKRIRELLNLAVEQKEDGRIQHKQGFEAPNNVRHLFEKVSAQGTDEYALWPKDMLVQFFAGITHGLMQGLDQIEEGVLTEYSVMFTRHGETVDFASYELGRVPAENELTVEVLDHAAAVLNRFLDGGYAIDEATALKLATHRHYKGGLYYRLFTARHSEREDDLVVYLHLFPHEPGAWARPLVMFEGENEAGQTRFVQLR